VTITFICDSHLTFLRTPSSILTTGLYKNPLLIATIYKSFFQKFRNLLSKTAFGPRFSHTITISVWVKPGTAENGGLLKVFRPVFHADFKDFLA
jgi:hypothetical protein